MSSLTVSAKGQVVIPLEIRERLGITPGSKVHVSSEGNRVTIALHRQKKPSDVMSGYGMLKYKGPPLKKSLLEVKVEDLMLESLKRTGKYRP
jgi:AbrB family looped-hinge helix DNA binding protein